MTWIEQLEQHGIRRIGSPRAGFRYQDGHGRPLSRGELARIRALMIPPAWTDVRINSAPSGKLQAIGKDRAGRWQYRYHPSFVKRQDEKKYQRLLQFARALPKMRRAIERDVGRPFLTREAVLASILRILSTSFLRPGSQVYVEENGSYGIATFQKRHVSIDGDTIRFSFRGKSGQHQTREIRDRQLAAFLKKLVRVPGGRLFKYRREDGSLINVRRRHINDYIKEVMGQRFSAKDFRTWAGTLIAACALARAGTQADESRSAVKRKLVAAIKETAQTLGNTPAICKASYIEPSILSAFQRGRVLERYFSSLEELSAYRGTGLQKCERALLEFLSSHAASSSVASLARAA